jgi:hypothetical protein
MKSQLRIATVTDARLRREIFIEMRCFDCASRWQKLRNALMISLIQMTIQQIV